MDDELIGEIKLFPYDFVPRSFMACNGQEISCSSNPALFSLIGTRFGGDGTSKFRLPDLQGKEPIPHTQYCICVNGMYPMRE